MRGANPDRAQAAAKHSLKHPSPGAVTQRSVASSASSTSSRPASGWASSSSTQIGSTEITCQARPCPGAGSAFAQAPTSA